MSGKGKGSAFERKIAKEIVKAFRRVGFEITQRDCWRSTLSGGHRRAAGDLEMSERLEQLFPYCLEMKHRKKIRYENFLLPKNSEERRWLRQTEDGAKKHPSDMTPVLVMRANHNPIYALIRESTIDPLSRPRLFVAEGSWRMILWKDFLRSAVVEAKAFQKKKPI